MAYLLNSFRPLVQTWFGRQAVSQYNLPKFVDASCRREPDFENPFPSMTSICRGAMGATRLYVGDHIVYMTVKGRYEPAAANGRYLIGGFRVIKRFDTHEAAAEWYTNQNAPIPSNCFVEGSEPLDYSFTGGHSPNISRRLKKLNQESSGKQRAMFDRFLKSWNQTYTEKVADNSTFIVTEPIKLNYVNPPILTDAFLHHNFGRIPATRTPCNISPDQFWSLMDLLKK